LIQENDLSEEVTSGLPSRMTEIGAGNALDHDWPHLSEHRARRFDR
jgi:hypothetical protein